MENFSLILNTGIQYYQLNDEVTIDINQNVMKALRFFEFQIKEKVYIDPVYYFPMKDKYLRRSDLVYAGYLDPVTNELVPEEVINNNMNWMDETQLVSINRLNVAVGDKKLSGLEQIEGRWLPLPLYEHDPSGSIVEPTDWCRIKLIPIEEKSTAQKRVYKVIIAVDTDVNTVEENVSPQFNGQPFKEYVLCGISQKDLDGMTEAQQKHISSMVIPMRAYEYCDATRQPWLNRYLQEVFNCTDLTLLPEGSRLKYLAYYSYFISYLFNLRIVPEIKLYNDGGEESIRTNLVIDVGNSRTFGLVAEDPLNLSFSKSSIITLRDLETGELYNDPFDMRLCFKEERFGFTTGGGQFQWPSIVRLGKEALRNIYDGEKDLLSNEQFNTSHSSPKRFLWDKNPYSGQWKFVSEKDRIAGPEMTVFIEGLMQQFRNDGSFTPDPVEMGERSSYSRSSLMTFCFIEILLQVRMQINSVEFRTHNGNESHKREISRVIITCPTAMPKNEQLTLRQCMQEASIVLKRYYGNTFTEVYNPEEDRDKIEIIPSVRDLSLTGDNIDLRRSWNYDEATCCQMVYLYSELRRYLGNTREFFNLYGRRRNGESEPSLTVASLDIGAGTSDIMICNYKNQGESVLPTPLFWESFHIAGDDIIKRIIMDVIIDNPNQNYPGASGIIRTELRRLNCPDIPNMMHHFFGDTNAMGVVERRMRKEFCVQVLIPIANRLISMLQQEEGDTVLTYDDIFGNQKPAECLMDFFAKHFGFRFENLNIKYSHDYLSEIVQRVMEPALRKWAAIFYKYKCDVVLMGGRPSSIKIINSMLMRLYPVTPNHLISMNNYRVGSWYPKSTDIGHFGDRKSMVAVGALIAYLAESGKLPMFRLTTEELRLKVKPTTEHIGLYNPHTGSLTPLLTPEVNMATVEISAFPIMIGAKQVDAPGYPAQMLNILDFDEEYLRTRAIEELQNNMGLTPDPTGSNIEPDMILSQMETLKYRIKQNLPLRFTIYREYFDDKEFIQIDSIQNNVADEIPRRMFKLAMQSWAEDESNWLDTGKFIMHIGN